jgi:hypothetical protein
MNTPKHSNRLQYESSLYLQQHAHNPVDWYPWTEEAFQKAKAENKLVLISVGYSSCHWCHVMEHETFEDEQAAAFMNQHFVNIKVDREERPDVDQVYMTAVQIMTQRGGWPLNCFALPDGRPIYGGTYFPKDQWFHILKSLVSMKKEEPEKMEEYAASLTEGIKQAELVQKNTGENALDTEAMSQMVQSWRHSWDTVKGGPNRAPKFPLPNNYEFLLAHGFREKDQTVLDYVNLSLRKMALGGIYDHVGGGFARYSTDPNWKVPHFEKMLYDNAQLIQLYALGFAHFKDPLFHHVCLETFHFLLREMRHPSGAFFSALDADSEGEEGKFYVFTLAELEQASGDLFEFAKSCFELNDNGLWEHGNYILLRQQDNAQLASSLHVPFEKVETELLELKHRLLSFREHRTRPGLDNKCLCSWNALLLNACCIAYAHTGDPEFKKVSLEIANWICGTMRKEDGGLWHNYNNNKAEINGYLDDYSFSIEAFISLYETTFDIIWLHIARELCDYALMHFYDEKTGMFFYTSDIDPPLIARKQEVMDNVIPASNSSMAKALFKLGKLLDRGHYHTIARQMLQNVLPLVDYGQSFSNWGLLHLYFTKPYFEIAISGVNAHDLAASMQSVYFPGLVYAVSKEPSSLPLLQNRHTEAGTIYVCVDNTCHLPVNGINEAMEIIRNNA